MKRLCLSMVPEGILPYRLTYDRAEDDMPLEHDISLHECMTSCLLLPGPAPQ